MKTSILYIVLALIAAAFCFFLYLNRGLPNEIVPAALSCLSLEEGRFEPLDSLPSKIYGIGLSYAGHINETASEFDPAADPPVFQKAVNSIAYTEANVTIPSSTALLQVADQFEAGLGKQLEKTHPNLPALMDYEVELGFVLLEDITPEEVLQDNYIPRLGFFVANDLSARSLAILGEGQTKRYDYWGISKSFPGFTPVGQQVWIPNEFQANAIPCVQLQTLVNGEVRQDQRTSDLIYTPLQMLQAIQRRYPDTPLRKGDWVLTGTPGGVILSTPRWLVRLANMIGADRFKKLESKASEERSADFLKPGDTVVTQAEGIGKVSINIVEN
ncbi:MAG: fumarylacetoacetate hydrolase family protein [Bacteroidota bacterium]